MKRLKKLIKRILLLPGFRRIPERMIIRKYVRGNLRSRSGEDFGTPFICEFDTADSARTIRYKDEVFSDYFRNSGLSPEILKGKRVLEIGPGKNLGVALEMLLSGAERVVCADRFPSLGSSADQLAVYRSIRDRLDESRKAFFDSIMTLGANSYSLNPDGLAYLTNAPLETLADKLPAESFDIILSRAVLEHVFDLEAALHSLDRLLAPGGHLLHEVDFRDHGIFTSFGLNPLTFLTVPDALWEKMGSHLGVPNRRLVDFFEARLSARGYKTDMLVKQIFGSEKRIDHPRIEAGRDYGRAEVALIEDLASRLLPRFRALPPEKILISVIFITARKPIAL